MRAVLTAIVFLPPQSALPPFSLVASLTRRTKRLEKIDYVHAMPYHLALADHKSFPCAETSPVPVLGFCKAMLSRYLVG
ncbi:hypothetical protein K469DRAFT_381309 [Zopfia rhizophila CBS 207.26]|uniref:Uncharacterized protein n=1 Tax=Zopfia rhizophila CBS 207.26 TaxID=1314779 RepID=A0A6A6DCD2_9PEZI|nr:hypothetical protein K469DRAFT_381309 [Zopfia rhizophila CBS 207.26]